MRNKVKVTWMVLTAVLVVVLFGLPYLVGIKAADQFEAFYENPPKFANISAAGPGFQRGWLTSEAVTRMEFESGNSLLLEHRVNHGLPPLKSVRVHTSLKEAHGLPPLPLRIDTYLGLLGRHTALLNMASLAWQHPKQGYLLKTVGARGRLRFSGDFSKFKGELSLPYWEVEARQGLWQVDNAALEFGGGRDENNFQGRLEGEITQLNWHPPYADHPLTLFFSEHQLSLYISEGRLAGQWKIESPRIRLQGEEHGSMACLLHGQRLDPATLRGLWQALKSPEENQNAGGLQRKWALLRHGATLLADQPELRVKQLLLNTSHGLVEGELTAHIHPPEIQNPKAFANPLSYMKLDAKLAAPREVLQQVYVLLARRALYRANPDAPMPPPEELEARVAESLERQLAEGVAKGYLLREENIYRTHVQVEAGRLTLNGVAVKGNGEL